MQSMPVIWTHAHWHDIDLRTKIAHSDHYVGSLRSPITSGTQTERMLASFIRRGLRLANSSITSCMSIISMSLCMWSRDKEDRRSFPIVDLSGVLIRFNPLKDLSAVQEVTGSTKKDKKGFDVRIH